MNAMNLEDLREYCLSLPGTTESVKWGDDLCFCVGEKMYAVTSLSGQPSLSVKVPTHKFDQYIESPLFIPAPYLARHKWVYSKYFTEIPKNEIITLIRES